jgi:acyl-CoA synthetase (AMP-forming)/AMP-acid ligase II
MARRDVDGYIYLVDRKCNMINSGGRSRIAGYKRPRSVCFISDDEMSRTITGKILQQESRRS